MSLPEPATERAISNLMVDEGWRSLVYDDATGKPIGPGSVVCGNPTIGYGWALNKQPMPQALGQVVLREFLTERVLQLHHRAPWVRHLAAERRAVLYELAYNLGVGGVLGFTKMLAALEAGDYRTAAVELLDSAAGRKLTTRYLALAYRLEHGRGPDQET